MARRVRQLGRHLSQRQPSSKSPALRCRGLHVAFGARRVLEGVDLEVDRGASVAIMGPSGSGKTTLLHCLAGLHRPNDGDIRLDGQCISALSERERARYRLTQVGMVFQFGELLSELSLRENVELPLRLRGVHDDEAVDRTLDRLGLSERCKSWPHELSGGEVQRASIARAVVGQPALVLADEPTGALDEDLSETVCELLLEVTRSLRAMLVVATHDPAVAGRMDRTLRLRRGKLEAP